MSEDLITNENQNSNPKIPRVENSKKGFKQSKKLSGLDKYLIFSFSCLIVFSITVLTIFCLTHEEPAVLVGCFFAAFGGEILMCALIKRLKLQKEAELKKEDNTWQQ